MKKIAASLVFILSLISGVTSACSDVESIQSSSESLSIIDTSFSVSEGDGHRMITSMGSIKNSSASCFESIVLEIKYFDAKGILIDTITQPLYGVVAPPSKEVAFRARDEAAKPRDAYVSQSVRVISADARRTSHNPKVQSNTSFFLDVLISWGPMLLLIGVWIFFMRRMKSKDSPQGKTLALFEKQNATLEAQNLLLERLTIAFEIHVKAQSGN